nr:hypothetical protein 8 [Gammaproteobacteria bacterium]
MPRRRKQLPRNALQTIENMMADGAREKDCAAMFMMSWPTWQRIRDEREDVRSAIERGRSALHDVVMGTLLKKCASGDTVACMFLAKTRFGYKEGYTVEQTNNVRVTFEVPAALPPSDYGKLVNPDMPFLENDKEGACSE